LQLHDHGGLGSVFLARDDEVHRDVALKQLNEDIASDPESRARFIFEAEITGNLEHPGIVPLYGKGQYADGRPYYAMRFIHGDTLKTAVDRLHKDARLKPDPGEYRRELHKLLMRFLVVCETMDYAHNKGVIHRDLKPKNIMLGPYGETLILDWGLAKVIGHGEESDSSQQTLRPPSSSALRETLAGERRGTASYMSPEQASGENDKLGVATDVYSLGATLYYVLTGRPPFTGDDLVAMLQNVKSGDFRHPRELNPRIDRALDAICRKAMSRQPCDRYASAHLIADDLERWLADMPVAAYPEPVAAKAMRWLRRRRQWVAAATAVLVLSLLGLSFHAWRLRRENDRVAEANTRATGQLGATRRLLRNQFKLASENLARYPNAAKDREQIAENMMREYAELGSAYPEDPAIAFETAEVYRILGSMRRISGELVPALDAYQHSIDHFSRLVDHPQKQYDAINGIAQDLIDRGELHRMNGVSTQAVKEIGLALEWLERLEHGPNRSAYIDKKASTLINLSDILYTQGKFDEASAAAGQAISLLLESPGKSGVPDPLGQKRPWLCVIARDNRGVAEAERGNTAEAESEFRKALLHVDEMSDESVYSVDKRCQKGITFARLGLLLRNSADRHGEAEQSLNQSVDVLTGLVKEQPGVPAFREELAVALNGRSRLHLDRGALDRARQDCAEAEKLLSALVKAAPANPQFLSLLGETTAIMSRIAPEAEQEPLKRKAISLYQQALKIDPDRLLDARKLSELLAR
jgi:serine/threonine-protein kinase